MKQLLRDSTYEDLNPYTLAEYVKSGDTTVASQIISLSSSFGNYYTKAEVDAMIQKAGRYEYIIENPEFKTYDIDMDMFNVLVDFSELSLSFKTYIRVERQVYNGYSVEYHSANLMSDMPIINIMRSQLQATTVQINDTASLDLCNYNQDLIKEYAYSGYYQYSDNGSGQTITSNTTIQNWWLKFSLLKNQFSIENIVNANGNYFNQYKGGIGTGKIVSLPYTITGANQAKTVTSVLYDWNFTGRLKLYIQKQ